MGIYSSISSAAESVSSQVQQTQQLQQMQKSTTASGIGSAISAAGQAINSVMSMVMQEKMASMMLAHQERMATSDYKFKSEQLSNADALMGEVAGIQKHKNSVFLENAKAHKDYDIATARRGEQKKNAEVSRIANKAAVTRALSGRSNAFYGRPVTTL